MQAFPHTSVTIRPSITTRVDTLRLIDRLTRPSKSFANNVLREGVDRVDTLEQK